ncbi:hypothetical protein A9Q84_11075 [Halobacteriovorax marinus]|uniref:N-acetyltransferase domain-containing protein n=1 Tax=Halobacteriovorax marinus TaxID=97084 RepID=A0A1Y5FBN6_9BACT|nr:hypothetical protein A9Q84_11075 [Halobacteriovorax marinus]
MSFEILPIEIDDVDEVLAFTDKWIGKNYYDKQELLDILHMGIRDGLNASLKAVVSGQLAGIRISLAPGNWIKPTSRGLTKDLWNVESDSMAYFKSLFVSGDFQKIGIGRALSSESIRVLGEMGAKGVLCHSWLESPGNSSQKYLLSFGFQPVKEHKLFWSVIDYVCTKCGPSKCSCTAIEMVKYL